MENNTLFSETSIDFHFVCAPLRFLTRVVREFADVAFISLLSPVKYIEKIDRLRHHSIICGQNTLERFTVISRKRVAELLKRFPNKKKIVIASVFIYCSCFIDSEHTHSNDYRLQYVESLTSCVFNLNNFDKPLSFLLYASSRWALQLVYILVQTKLCIQVNGSTHPFPLSLGS